MQEADMDKNNLKNEINKKIIIIKYSIHMIVISLSLFFIFNYLDSRYLHLIQKRIEQPIASNRNTGLSISKNGNIDTSRRLSASGNIDTLASANGNIDTRASANGNGEHLQKNYLEDSIKKNKILNILDEIDNRNIEFKTSSIVNIPNVDKDIIKEKVFSQYEFAITSCENEIISKYITKNKELIDIIIHDKKLSVIDQLKINGELEASIPLTADSKNILFIKRYRLDFQIDAYLRLPDGDHERMFGGQIISIDLWQIDINGAIKVGNSFSSLLPKKYVNLKILKSLIKIIDKKLVATAGVLFATWVMPDTEIEDGKKLSNTSSKIIEQYLNEWIRKYNLRHNASLSACAIH